MFLHHSLFLNPIIIHHHIELVEVLEEVVSATDDDSLYDNAKGFSNFATRVIDLNISKIIKKSQDNNDTNFVELLEFVTEKLRITR